MIWPEDSRRMLHGLIQERVAGRRDRSDPLNHIISSVNASPRWIEGQVLDMGNCLDLHTLEVSLLLRADVVCRAFRLGYNFALFGENYVLYCVLAWSIIRSCVALWFSLHHWSSSFLSLYLKLQVGGAASKSRSMSILILVSAVFIAEEFGAVVFCIGTGRRLHYNGTTHRTDVT